MPEDENEFSATLKTALDTMRREVMSELPERTEIVSPAGAMRSSTESDTLSTGTYERAATVITPSETFTLAGEAVAKLEARTRVASRETRLPFDFTTEAPTVIPTHSKPEGSEFGYLTDVRVPGIGHVLEPVQLTGEGVVCACEMHCGPPCMDESKLPLSDEDWKSNPHCETQVNESMALRVTLAGNPSLTSPLRVYSPSDHVRFGEMRFVGYGPHAGGLPGLWPIWDLSCRAPDLTFPMIPCDTAVDMLVCADKEGEYEIIAKWGNITCKRTIKVKKCVCACFQAEFDAAWELFFKCPEALELYRSIGIEKGPKIPGVSPGDITAKCIEVEAFEEQFGSTPDAAWDTVNHAVLIKCGNDHLVASFLFELTNAASRDAHAEVNKKALKGELSRDDFVREAERIEWKGTRRAHEIAKACVAAGIWPKETDRYAYAFENNGPWNDFEKYLKHVKSLNHHKVYVDWWDANAKKAYEEKNK